MNKNNELSNGERLVCLETKVDIMNETLNSTATEVKELSKMLNTLLPTYITRVEMKAHSSEDDEKFNNLRKANKLQIWLTGIIGTGFGAVMMYLITFYLENKH